MSGIVYSCAFFVIAFFALISAFYTSAISGAMEMTFYLADSPALNAIAIILFVGILFFASQSSLIRRIRTGLDESPKAFTISKIALLICIFIASEAWTIIAFAKPYADSNMIQECVNQFLNGDYQQFGTAGYLDHYPYQLGFFWASWAISKVFGANQFFILRTLNAIGVALVYKTLSEIGGEFGLCRISQLCVMAIGLAFFPLLQYASFIYGTVWGLALSLIAMKHELYYLKTRRVRYLTCSVCAISIAVFLKGNYAVFAIAMIIYALIWFVDMRKVCAIALSALVVCGVTIMPALSLVSARSATGCALDQGESSFAYIAMGLQESEMAPGWYNGYNLNSYNWAEFNTANHARLAKESIRESIMYMADHKRYAMEFFVKKTAAQWNNPTFQGFWLSDVMMLSDPQNSWKLSWHTPRFIDNWSQYLNVIQLLILVGVFFWLIIIRWTSSANAKYALLIIAFFGGFLCHLFWEGKCQYTLPYFTLLIPYSVNGYGLLCNRIAHYSSRFLRDDGNRRAGDDEMGCLDVRSIRSDWVPIAVASLVFIAGVSLLYAGGMDSYLSSDGDAYQKYLIDREIDLKEFVRKPY